ncbi:NAD(P)-binding domain-containing protein [Novosphingobium sp. KCTC 2891]|uniref:NAD(P)-dependent oxidoreductase n=1 Tax=Novosphingobium sp. KCTC 2891 TaxID=2989730 RepID=UPI0022232FED|nr:NAD(P)-dependent oxidoreductase [Novosphingobium sp. KCTC 2891]MCW1384075.1 NAD(P)-binding domain-containing protein [Novosphingobium sp. KCTC 2891]
MSLIVASQIGPEFDSLAASHPAVARVIPLPLDDAAAVGAIAAEADALIVRPAPVWKSIAAAGPPAAWPGKLRWVHSTSAGVDYYPEWLADAPWFSCGRGAASDQVADYVIGAIYAHAKDFAALSIHAADQWAPRPQRNVFGRTVAILGLGSIGLAIAHRVRALGAHPVGIRRSGAPADGIAHAGSIEEAVAIADDIVIALPATGATRGLVDARLLAHAKPDAHLINIARGSIVDQDALLAALDADRLGFATLDVTDPEPLPAGHPLYTHPKVRVTPHLSSNWPTVIPGLHRQILDNIAAVAQGGPPANLVIRSRGY